jgi:hypothetical protein
LSFFDIVSSVFDLFAEIKKYHVFRHIFEEFPTSTDKFHKILQKLMKMLSETVKIGEKNSGQKSITLAHSGGHNLVKMIFCLFFSHYASKFCTICLKIGSNRSSSRERQKMATMGRYLEKSSTDFF